MRTYPSRIGIRVRLACLSTAVLLVATAMARGESQQDLIRKVNPSIVEVHSHLDRGTGTGSGFVVDEKMGLVFTNFHVVNGANDGGRGLHGR